jgi:peptidoglycan hydrolase-like protein with peptidoglycan-binding domain
MCATLVGLAVSTVALSSFLFTNSTIQAATLSAAQIQAIVSLLQAFGADPSVIANVQANLTGMPTASFAGPSVQANCITLYNNLYVDQTDATTNSEITKLQQYLGGRVTGYFGPATLQLVQSWQTSHGVVSTGSPDTTGFGYVGPKTRLAMSCQTSPTTSANTGLGIPTPQTTTTPATPAANGDSHH